MGYRHIGRGSFPRLSIHARPVSTNAPIGELIRSADTGNPAAAAALFSTMYDELHRIAARELRRSGGDLTLGTTTLLHEAYLSLSAGEGTRFENRAHFLTYAARAMRTLTIDYYRRRRATKRGGEFHFTVLSDDGVGDPVVPATEQVEEIGEALETLGAVHPALANLVDLHFFCGFTLTEIAQLRGVSERTVQRDWRKARLLLHRSIGGV
jgi:RNA polymerase sigma factor (TIGR02999 family)